MLWLKRTAPARCLRARHYQTAQAFLAALHPLHNHWRPNPSNWIYRGQRDARWSLLPSALRADSWVPFRRNRPSYDPAKEDEEIRRNREKVALAGFFSNLDDIGYPIPGDNPTLRDAVVAVSRSWPDDELFPFLAFAQHYGVPTRLLDWSASARNAAYFAAVDALNNEAVDGNLVVWALNRVFLDSNRTDPPAIEVRLVSAARASNPNLHAQQGLFTLCRRNDQLLPLEQIVLGVLSGTIAVSGTIVRYPPRKLVMQKLTLPQTEAWRLLELLNYENVTGATMFPTPAGAIKRMIEPNHWRHRPPIYPLYSDDDLD